MIPGVALASFIYLGFLSAGDEIEQPFGMTSTFQQRKTRLQTPLGRI
jgi:hypothetical protein